MALPFVEFSYKVEISIINVPKTKELCSPTSKQPVINVQISLGLSNEKWDWPLKMVFSWKIIISKTKLVVCSYLIGHFCMIYCPSKVLFPLVFCKWSAY